MTTYSFPALTPSRSSFELVTNTKTFKSPLTNAIQTSGRKGAVWRVTMAFNNLFGSDRAEMQAFLTKLNGQEHRFYLQDHSFTRRGAGGGTLLINGAAQSGSTLVCNGATVSVTDYLLPGDYIAFNNELHMVTTAANSDGSGNVSLLIAPPIRKQTNNDDLVDYAVPVLGVFILASDVSWDNNPGINSSFTIDAIEDVLA
tara:strand:+ start:246 stop:845 length:600 start_codon:yes stop_codon:yes gene_type:complete